MSISKKKLEGGPPRTMSSQPQRPQPSIATLCFPCWQVLAPTSWEMGKAQWSPMALGTE